MALRIPVGPFEVEYRGVQPGGEFPDRVTGAVVSYAPKLKFEYDEANGDVVLFPVGSGQIDKCVPPVDFESFKKGERYTLRGFAILADKGSDKDSYLRIESCIPVLVKRPTQAGV